MYVSINDANIPLAYTRNYGYECTRIRYKYIYTDICVGKTQWPLTILVISCGGVPPLHNATKQKSKIKRIVYRRILGRDDDDDDDQPVLLYS